MNDSIKQRMDEHAAVLSKLSEAAEPLEAIARSVADCFLNGGRLYICGSGASHIIAKYIESLFMGVCRMQRPPLPAITLLADSYLLGERPADIFEQQLTALLTPVDVVFAISSQSSEALTKALRYAGQTGAGTVGLAGRDQGTLRGLCDSLVVVEHADPLLVTEIHMLLAHIICQRVDEMIFKIM
ncbi:MAG: SIS domain-containing protein [Deferribacteraceae bacterium]|jgi:D-sedoheptulose 7-phosphate isomerase|nr:SIS domain-containing protein [Deferribacteraceae bacterium]